MESISEKDCNEVLDLIKSLAELNINILLEKYLNNEKELNNVLNTLIKKYPQIVDSTINDKSLLMHSITYGYDYTFDFLIKNNVNVDYVNKYGLTALIIATQDRDIDKFVKLMDSGADYKIKIDGKNLLMIACEYDCYDIATYLIYKKFFNLDEKDDKGFNALLYCSENSEFNIIDELLKNEADPYKPVTDDGYDTVSYYISIGYIYAAYHIHTYNYQYEETLVDEFLELIDSNCVNIGYRLIDYKDVIDEDTMKEIKKLLDDKKNKNKV